MSKTVFKNVRNTLFGAGLAVATAISALPAQAANEKIVAIFNNMSEPFFIAMNRAILDEAKKIGVEVVVLDGQSNSPKQSTDMRNAIAQHVAGIIIAPNEVKALATVVDEAEAAGIPVVTVDRRVEGTKKPVAHFGADNVAGGRKMAEWVVKNFPDGARIIHLTGQPGSSSGMDRAKGVHEGFEAAGDKYKIVAEQTANWQRAQGLSVGKSLLTSMMDNPPNVIIGADDDTAMGALEAVHMTGLDKADIKVLGFNATPEALGKVKKGEMVATVEQSPSKQIRTALNALVANIRDKAELKPASIEPILITKDNLQDADRFSEMKK